MERRRKRYVLALSLAMSFMAVLPALAGGSGSVSVDFVPSFRVEGEQYDFMALPLQEIRLDNIPAMELFIVTDVGPYLGDESDSDDLPGAVAAPEPTVIIFLFVSSLIVMKRWHFHETMKKRHHWFRH
ncbi:MAG: hypothetical protein JW745_06250 [Sedimentisphaerales bacterium]|nr:hypothetical protein [Sedimentisphaerales bacterium]MBN2842956.1 hypothetical protein [Sedimentisphaerales bacterium]